MKSRAAIALMVAALAWPAVAQRGSSHGGSSGSRSYAGRGTFSGRPSFSARPGLSTRPGYGHPGTSAPRGYAPASPFRYGSLGPPPAVRFNPPRISAPSFAAGRNGFIASRPRYQPGLAGRSHQWDHDRDRDGDRDRFHARARSFQNWYLFGYPEWLGYGYPYVLDPGFYDWSDYDNSGYGQNDQASGYDNENPGYPPDYPYGENAQPGGGISGQPDGSISGQLDEQPQPWPEPETPGTIPQSHFSVSGQTAAAAPALEGPLTVIFKGGRAPETMQNYMLTSKSLTDLDADHYVQIPIDQIDIAATARANRASGMEFRIPGSSQD